MGFVAQLAIWLWFTVLFANFAEAMAEGRGKAQAASLRRARKETMARRLQNGRDDDLADRVDCRCRRGDRASGAATTGLALDEHGHHLRPSLRRAER